MGSSVGENRMFQDTIKLPSSSETLILLGHGITDMTIETIHVTFTEIGVYCEPSISEHLKAWKGRAIEDLTNEESGFHKQLVEAPVKKLIKVVLIKSQKGSQYGSSVETRVRDTLAYDDKYEEEEEQALSDLVEFIQGKSDLKPGSEIVYLWPAGNDQVEVSVYQSGSRSTATHVVHNKNVACAILEWFISATSVSPSTVESVAANLA